MDANRVRFRRHRHPRSAGLLGRPHFSRDHEPSASALSTQSRTVTSHQSAVGGIVVDADGAIGHVAAAYATDLGLAALTTKSSVFVAVQACGHLGALGIYAVQ